MRHEQSRAPDIFIFSSTQTNNGVLHAKLNLKQQLRSTLCAGSSLKQNTWRNWNCLPNCADHHSSHFIGVEVRGHRWKTTPLLFGFAEKKKQNKMRYICESVGLPPVCTSLCQLYPLLPSIPRQFQSIVQCSVDCRPFNFRQNNKSAERRASHTR